MNGEDVMILVWCDPRAGLRDPLLACIFIRMSAGLHEDGARQASEPRHARAPSYECVTTAETMV